MGAWGSAVFSDDFACDVREDYLLEVYLCRSNEEATDKIIAQHLPPEGDEDFHIFWIALALTQWKNGRLLNFVKENALVCIDQGTDLERWQMERNPKNVENRMDVLRKAREILLSPQPPLKNVSKPKWYWVCPWQPGDLLCFQLTGNEVAEQHKGKYILVRVIRVDKYGAALAAYAWLGDGVPDADLSDTLEYVLLHRQRVGCEKTMCDIWALSVQFRETESKSRHLVRLGNDPSFQKALPSLCVENKRFSSLGVEDYEKTFSKAMQKRQS